MECKLVIKDYNSLYTIYLTKLCKVLVGVINRVNIVFNFYIYKELFCYKPYKQDSTSTKRRLILG